MFNEELIAAKVAARNAGKILMKYYKSEDNEVKMKGIDNPVTIADNEADKYLSEFLILEFRACSVSRLFSTLSSDVMGLMDLVLLPRNFSFWKLSKLLFF